MSGRQTLAPREKELLVTTSMKLFLLLLLTGLCSGIQYPLQYLYHYRAKVSTGIPGLNDKHSAISELRANLNVYVTSPTHIVFKLDDVSFGEFNGIHDCEEESDDQPPSWVSPQYATELGQFPFAVESGNLIFNVEEKQWTINFYKSIVSLFSIAPLKEAFYGSSSNHSYSAAYETTEDTVMGMCRNTYTQHKLTGVAAAQREIFASHHVTEDVQEDSLGEYVAVGSSKTTRGRKTTAGRRRKRATKRPRSKTSKTSKTSPNVLAAPTISNTLWEVVRTVNLENCVDRVEHQHTLGSIYCLLSTDQCKNLFSRNSHGVYYIRGDENGMRLEKAAVKGAIVISPYGQETEHMETITKQKVALVSVNHLDSEAPSLSGQTTVSVDKLVYELTLPYGDALTNQYRWAKGGDMRETLAELTGVHLTAEQRTENEERVATMLNGATELQKTAQSRETATIPKMLNYASRLMFDFSVEEIDRVFAALNFEAKTLMYGVLAEVGTEPAVSVMIKKLKDGEVSAFRQVMYFASMNINIKSPFSFRDLLEFLYSQNIDETPFKTSQSLINFASVVKRLCLSKGDGSNSFEEMARERCASDMIVSSFQEYLISGLETETFWKQLVFVQALVNLRTAEATNALLPFVLGARECDTIVRAVAMDSLASWNSAGRVYRSKIVLILLDIFENPGESRLLRARALGYLASWQLSSSDWTRLALATKRPGLKDLAALTYSLIKSTSEYEHPDMIQQRQYAQHALHLAKPTSAAERYSSYRSWYKYNFEEQVGGVDHIALIKDPMSPLPAELALYMRRALGGIVFFKKADVMIANDNGDLDNIAMELLMDMQRPFYDDTTRGRWTNFLNMLKTDLNIAETANAAVRGLANLVPIAGIQLFVPFEHVMLVDAMRSISFEAPYISLAGPSSLYLNPVDGTFTTVNDLGLPVITTVARPTLITFGGEISFYNSGPGQYVLNGESTRLLSSTAHHINVETVIPWSHSQLSTGVGLSTAINLPVSFNVDFSWSYRPTRQQFSIVRAQPSVFTEVDLMRRENMPYTLIRDTAPANLQDLVQAIKVIVVNGEKGPKYQIEQGLPLLPMKYSYLGDVKSVLGPIFNKPASILKFFSPGGVESFDKFLLVPSLKMFQSVISADFSNAETSFFKANYTSETADRLPNAGKLVSMYGQDSFQDYELCGQEDSADSFTQQTGQQSSNDYMYEQSSQSVQSPDFESFGSFGQQQAQVPAQLNEPTEAETVRPSQGIGDVSEPQLKNFLSYLQRQAGWKSKVIGSSVRLVAERNQFESFTYELLMATTSCYSLQNQIQKKDVIVMAKKGDPCDTVCYEAELTQPKITDLDTLPLILEKPLDRTTKTELYTGTKCSQGPFHSTREKRQLTEAGLKRLVSELEEEKCRTHGQVNLVEEFAKRAQYDKGSLELNVTFLETFQCRSPLASSLIDFFMMFRENILGWTNPTICARDIQGNKMVYSSEGERNEDGEFITKEKFGQTELTQPSFHNNPIGVQLNSIAHRSDYEAADYCVIDDHSVTTFDGKHANFTAGACHVLVSTPCQEGQADVFAVNVKTSRNGGLAVQMAGQKRQFFIYVDAEGIDINGEPMAADQYVQTLYYETRYGQRTSVAGHVYRRNGFYKVEIDETIDVLFKEGRVYIKVAARYRGYMCGMCGNYDDEPSNDLKAPNGCLITDTEQFAKAWTPSTGFDCFAEQQTDADTCLKEEPLPQDYYQQYQL